MQDTEGKVRVKAGGPRGINLSKQPKGGMERKGPGSESQINKGPGRGRPKKCAKE